MERILIIEDSVSFSNFIKASIEYETGLKVDVARNFAEGEKLLANGEYFAAVSDLNLPDADTGAMVGLLTTKGIATIVYTGDYSDELRDKIWKKPIVDYVLKRDPDSDKYVSRLICQLRKNVNIDVMVVDDSRVMRSNIEKLLKAHLFRVHTFASSKEALDAADTLPNLKLVISDYMMPDMDGFEFVRALRKKYPKDKVAFIGVSGTQKEHISAKFIKFGANDFMMKPFSHEQFYTRVNQNLQMLMMIENILDLSFKDFLTGLYNRRYFFREMELRFQPESEKTIAIMDIDFFKRVNDTYGHDGGDAVLRTVAKLLNEHVGTSGFVTRFGGEEFCIFLNHGAVDDYFEIIRKKVEDLGILFDGKVIKVTASFGVTCKKGVSVDAMITEADSLLYDAKTSGRNRVFSNC